jgi:osmotically-inducible protein OsmY
MRWLSVFAILLAVAGSASAVGQPPTAADDQIKTKIEQRLFDAGLVTVAVAVQDGHVTLSGHVEDLKSKDAAAKEARKVKGVKDVTSTLTITAPESDKDLAKSVSDALVGASFLTMFDEVTSPDKSRRAVEEVSAVPGVQKVVNQIEVLPASTFDDEIRVAVADRIYNALPESTYGNPSARPVHIIVKNGHVRLVGYVPNEMSKRLAEMLARQVSGVHDVENALEVG